MTTQVGTRRRSRTRLALAFLGLAVGAGVFTATSADAAPVEWKAVAAGNSHTCALNGAGVAYCWGDNSFGQLGSVTGTLPASGNGTPPTPGAAAPTAVTGPAANERFTLIAAGDNHSCALTVRHTVLCWGSNVSGQLGNGTVPAGDPKFTSTPAVVGGALAGQVVTNIAAGGSTTCALTAKGLAYCWGDNSQGEIGIGSAGNPVPTPTAVNATGALAGKSLVRITVGGQHVCAVATDQTGFCWGGNANGEVGAGGIHEPGQGGQYLVPVPIDPTFVAQSKVQFTAIAASTASTCAIGEVPGASGNAVYCWGKYIKAVPNGSDGTVAFSPRIINGTVPPGIDTAGALAGRTALAISAGGSTVCVLDEVGSAVCWGDGAVGQLGDGSSGNPVPSPPHAVKVSRPYAGIGLKGISVGVNHVCAVNRPNIGGAAACWGSNGQGQLGIGIMTVTTSAVPHAVAPVTATSPTSPATPTGDPTDPANNATSSSSGLPLPLIAGAVVVVLALVGLLVARSRRRDKA